MSSRIALALLAFLICLLPLSGALAAKSSKVTDISGQAWVVRVNPEGTWGATWSLTGLNQYTLFVFDAAKGGKPKNVTTSDDPGGLCWIPGKNRLFFCKARAVKGESVAKGVPDFHILTYYTYDPVKAATRKAGGGDNIHDEGDTYILDPVPADDGSKVFFLTIFNALPSFNIYFPESNVMSNMLAKARHMSSDYDLSSDGNTVYWPMSDSASGDLVMAGWSLVTNYYSQLYEWKKDPAKERGGFKVNSTSRQAVTLANNEADPALKAAVYSFRDPKNPQAIPIHLRPEEEIVIQGWKGRSGLLYMLIGHAGKTDFTGPYSIIEVNPVDGARTTVLSNSTDEIKFVDYAPRSGTYFYSVSNGKDSRVVKLQ